MFTLCPVSQLNYHIVQVQNAVCLCNTSFYFLLPQSVLSFLQSLSGITPGGRLRRLDINKYLRVESQLLFIKRSQPRWFPGSLPGEVFWLRPTGRRPRGRSRTRCRDDLLAGLGTPPEKLEEVAGKRKAFAETAAPMTQTWISGRKWMDKWMFSGFYTPTRCYFVLQVLFC